MSTTYKVVRALNLFATEWLLVRRRVANFTDTEGLDAAYEIATRALDETARELAAHKAEKAAAAVPLKLVPLPDPAEQWQAHQGPDEEGLVNLYTEDQMRAYALDFAEAHGVKLERKVSQLQHQVEDLKASRDHWMVEAAKARKTPSAAPELWVFTFDNGITEWTQNPEQAEQIKRHLRERETVTEYVKLKGT